MDELLEAYEASKRNYYLGDHRPNAVEGGRFCEAAFRLLQQAAFGTYDKVGKQIDTQGLIRRLESAPASAAVDSIRLHIPRALRVVYDIRNKRDAAHLADDIDPNLQDATLVISVLDWVMAEFVRLYHDVDADEAQAIVEELVTRGVPVVEDFDGFLKVLKGLSASDHFVVLLYHRGDDGATVDQLREWAKPKMRANILRTLRSLDENGLIHQSGTL
ncbi:MAG TPA: hypothetical protein VMW19_09155, partial [Myxococcota bacterium]|nr:hypothetical protein [Myxococcota bacterium]